MAWWSNRSTNATAAAVLAAAVLAGCATRVPLDQPTPRVPIAMPPPPPSLALPSAEPASAPEPPPAATPMPVAPTAEAASAPQPAASEPPPAAPFDGPIATEARWLQQWFDGTPVVIAPQGDGSLLVEVPAEFCFDAGLSAVKPPLGAVLTRVRSSMERQPSLRLRIEAPAEAGGVASLARERSGHIRESFIVPAISPTRVTELDGLPGSPVRLVLQPALP